MNASPVPSVTDDKTENIRFGVVVDWATRIMFGSTAITKFEWVEIEANGTGI